MKKLFAVLLLCLALPAWGQNTTNLPVQLVAAGAKTAATVSSGDQTNTSWIKGQILINVSAYTSGNYTPHIQGKDPVSGSYYDLLVGSAISATGLTVLTIGPGVLPLPNASSASFLPRTWRVQLIGASTPSMTLSVGAVLGN